MNKRGSVIIISFLSATLLMGFLSAIFVQATSESRLARRQANSVNAFWLAEAGIEKVKNGFGLPSNTSGTIANPSDTSGNTYAYNVTVNQIGGTGYYQIVSTGTVTSPGSVVSRTVRVTMKTDAPDASKFQYCVETTGPDLTYKSKNVVNPSGKLVRTNSTQAFADLFGVDMITMKAGSNYFQDVDLSPSNTITGSGITWIDVTQGSPLELSIQHLNGSGIVVVNGDFRLNGVAGGGGSTFNGILYVVGKFYMSGNATVNGTVFVESSTEIGEDENELTGSSLVSYNALNIDSSLGSLATKTLVSWEED